MRRSTLPRRASDLAGRGMTGSLSNSRSREEYRAPGPVGVKRRVGARVTVADGLTPSGTRSIPFGWVMPDPSSSPNYRYEAIMLVAISDLHITDERTAINVPQGAFDILEREIIVNASDRRRERSISCSWATSSTWSAPTTGTGRRATARCPWRSVPGTASSRHHRHEPRPSVEQQFRDIWRTSSRRTAPSHCWR